MSYTVYIDTSIIKLLSTPPSRDPITRACQQLTRRGWSSQREPEMSYSSHYVNSEIMADEPLLAENRLLLSAQNKFLPEDNAIDSLAELLVCGGGLRSSAQIEARHIACAAINRLDILVTWNCTDIANPFNFRLMRMLVRSHELRLPELVTPFELLEHKL